VNKSTQLTSKEEIAMFFDEVSFEENKMLVTSPERVEEKNQNEKPELYFYEVDDVDSNFRRFCKGKFKSVLRMT
jgi:hypothetical protein